MAGKINIPITTAIQGLANTTRQLNTLSSSITKVGKTAGLAAIGYAAFAAGIKAGDFALQAISGARDLERNMLGLKTVFEDMEPQMRLFSRNAEEVGLSLNEASKASVFIGSVLKQSGFSIQETADLTERLVKLGTDLSLTYGYDVQEALLGMTALFRGEYDPIEKFGVALKQSEVNSELFARGQDKLTGAARRFAEQQIRVELLFQRAADAQGAFQRGAGTLAVEQLRLQAAFSNMRDTVAENLLPALGLLTLKFREALQGIEPKIKESFEELEPILYDLGNILIPALANAIAFVIDGFNNMLRAIRPLLDPTTQLGGAISDLIFRIDSLFATLSNVTPTTDQARAFEFLNNILTFTVELLGRIIYWIEFLATKKRIWEEFFQSIFEGDWDTLFQDWDAYTNIQIANLDLTKQQKQAQFELNYQLEQTELRLRNIQRANLGASANADRAERNRFERLRSSIEQITGGVDGGGESTGAKAAKNYIKDFTENIKNEIQKQTAREQLAIRGASEGLIDAILGSEGWMKVWIAIKQGKIVLDDLQKEFNQTAAGAKEVADSLKEIDDYFEEIEKIQLELDKELASIAKEADKAKREFADLFDAFSILPTVQREIGQFEAQATGLLAQIESSLRSAFDNEDIYEDGYRSLRDFAREQLAQLASIGRQRDEFLERFDLAKGLIDNYKRAFTAAASLTTLFDQLKEETETRTVTSVSRALMRLGGSMREFEVTISSTYEETIGGIQNKSEGILQGFRDLAEKARAFGENLRKLRALGLHGDLFQQLIDAGIDAGGATAQALVEGGADTINEINNLYKDIEAVGSSLGEEVAISLYGTGVDLANGLLEGIRSRQQELENEARNLAEKFNSAFRSALSVQVDRVAADRASAAIDAAQKEMDKIEKPKALEEQFKVDEEALKRIDALIKGAVRYIGAITDATKKAGAQIKLDIYRSLEADIRAGRAIDLSGIQSGMTTGELAAAAQRAGGTGVTNIYNVNVTADTRTSGAKAGEAVVETLQKFGQVNGAFDLQVAF